MRFLKDNIFVTAPSDAIYSVGDKLRLENAIKKFNNIGIKVILGKTVEMKNLYNDEEYKLKALEVEKALLDDNIDTVIAANGGETEINIIEYFDFEKLKDKKEGKKIFQGFSDNSILTFLLATLSDWKTYYAPCFPTFGYDNWDKTISDNLELLKGNIIEQSSQDFFETYSLKKVKGKELYGYNLDTTNKVVDLTNNDNFIINGTLLGGCMDVLKAIINTKYDKLREYNRKHKNIIWFIENCALSIEELKSTLQSMEKNEWFKNVRCFMIGRGKITLDQQFLNEQNNILLNILSKYNVPIIINCDFGHVRPFNTLITGGDAILTYKNGKYTIKYENIN